MPAGPALLVQESKTSRDAGRGDVGEEIGPKLALPPCQLAQSVSSLSLGKGGKLLVDEGINCNLSPFGGKARPSVTGVQPGGRNSRLEASPGSLSLLFSGGSSETRTLDPRIKSPLLYQLS
jgi:hypothetical protein